MRGQQRVDSLVQRRIVVQPEAQEDVGVDADPASSPRRSRIFLGSVIGLLLVSVARRSELLEVAQVAGPSLASQPCQEQAMVQASLSPVSAP